MSEERDWIEPSEKGEHKMRSEFQIVVGNWGGRWISKGG